MGKILKIKTLFAAVALLAFCGSGCNNGGDDAAKAKLDATINGSSTLNWDETGRWLQITASGYWELSTVFEGQDNGWCVPAQVSGTGNANVWLAIAQNRTAADRKVSVTVGSGTKKVELTLSQSKKPEQPVVGISAVFDGSGKTTSAAWNQASLTIGITTDDPQTAWTVSIDEGGLWCTPATPLTGTGTGSVTFTLAQNLSRATRPAAFTVISPRGNISLSAQQRYMRPELPAVAEPQWYREYTQGEFVLEYSTAAKHAKWVAWPLHAGHLGTGRTDAWKFDASLDPYNPVYGGTGQPNDYRDQVNLNDRASTITYDRGHLCPSGDRNANSTLNSPTFYYSNISPQVPDLNQGIWEQLESKEQGWAKVQGDTLYICAGGHVLDEADIRVRTVPSQMYVPSHYFKVVLRKKPGPVYQAVGFWFDNRLYTGSTGTRSGALAYRIDEVIRSVDEIETLTGLDFFTDLPADIQTTVERQKDKNAWGF